MVNIQLYYSYKWSSVLALIKSDDITLIMHIDICEWLPMEWYTAAAVEFIFRSKGMLDSEYFLLQYLS